jgi:hypothetical protein
MQNINIQNYSLHGLWDRVIWLVSAEVSVRTYCIHLLMACEDRLRMLLQNIHHYIPHYMGSSMRPHYKSSPLWVPQILYLKMWWWKCHTGKTTLQKSSMFFTNMAFSITYSFHHLCTQFFIFCLLNKLKKKYLQILPGCRYYQYFILWSGAHMTSKLY